jgi:hypothetical protein
MLIEISYSLLSMINEDVSRAEYYNPLPHSDASTYIEFEQIMSGFKYKMK